MMKHSGALMSSRLMPPQLLPSSLHAIDELVRVLGRDFEIDGIDVGEALEQHRLAFHHRLGRQRAAIAETENGGAVGDDGDEIALGGVVVGAAFILGDGQHRNGDARRIGEREVALRRHRLGGHHFELARPALAVKQQGFLVGKGRPVRAVARFRPVFEAISIPCCWARRSSEAARWTLAEPTACAQGSGRITTRRLCRKKRRILDALNKPARGSNACVQSRTLNRACPPRHAQISAASYRSLHAGSGLFLSCL